MHPGEYEEWYGDPSCAACGSDDIRMVGDVPICKHCGATCYLDAEEDDDVEGKPAQRHPRQYDDGY